MKIRLFAVIALLAALALAGCRGAVKVYLLPDPYLKKSLTLGGNALKSPDRPNHMTLICDRGRVWEPRIISIPGGTSTLYRSMAGPFSGVPILVAMDIFQADFAGKSVLPPDTATSVGATLDALSKAGHAVFVGNLPGYRAFPAWAEFNRILAAEAATRRNVFLIDFGSLWADIADGGAYVGTVSARRIRLSDLLVVSDRPDADRALKEDRGLPNALATALEANLLRDSLEGHTRARLPAPISIDEYFDAVHSSLPVIETESVLTGISSEEADIFGGFRDLRRQARRHQEDQALTPEEVERLIESRRGGDAGLPPAPAAGGDAELTIGDILVRIERRMLLGDLVNPTAADIAAFLDHLRSRGWRVPDVAPEEILSRIEERRRNREAVAPAPTGPGG